MRKSLLITCLSVWALSTAAMAQYKSGGYTGTTDTTNLTTVKQVENLPGDSYVTMQGKIISKIGHEKYMFQDETGTIKIEIDDDDWNGVTANPDSTVQIQGEVDKSWTKPTKIEVDFIQKVEPQK